MYVYHSQEEVLGLMEFSFIDNSGKLQAITIVLFMLTSGRVVSPNSPPCPNYIPSRPISPLSLKKPLSKAAMW